MYLPEPNGDELLKHLEEISACAAQVDEIALGLALQGTSNQAVMAEALVKITVLNRRISKASEKAERIRRENSARVRAALEREARKRGDVD